VNTRDELKKLTEGFDKFTSKYEEAKLVFAKAHKVWIKELDHSYRSSEMPRWKLIDMRDKADVKYEAAKSVLWEANEVYMRELKEYEKDMQCLFPPLLNPRKAFEQAISKSAISKPNITAPIREQFQALSNALSPENLYEDGEISREQAQRKYRSIMREWKELERQVGRKVSESEVW